MDACERGVAKARVGDLRAVAVDDVDDARRKARGLEEPHQVIGREALFSAGFHTTTLPIRAQDARQVPGDGREVERRDGEHEALEGPQLEVVLEACGGDRLVLGEPRRKGDVEAEEIDELTGRVDLCLVGGLALAEHRRRVDHLTPRAREELGRAGEDARPLVRTASQPRRARPPAPRRSHAPSPRGHRRDTSQGGARGREGPAPRRPLPRGTPSRPRREGRRPSPWPSPRESSSASRAPGSRERRRGSAR